MFLHFYHRRRRRALACRSPALRSRDHQQQLRSRDYQQQLRQRSYLRHLLFLFDAEELDCVLCGADEIDFNDWKCNIKYTSGLHEHPSFEAFLESRQRDAARVSKRLLHFAAGSSRVPLGGFGELTNYAGHQCPFALKAISFAETRIVRAHSCFNRSDLPLFATKKDVKDALYTVLDAEMYQHISNYTSSRQRGNEQEEPKEDKYD
ncbi:Nedd4 e3 ubiquitin-protein ligase wwp1, partial [Globisporangium splendens]